MSTNQQPDWIKSAAKESYHSQSLALGCSDTAAERHAALLSGYQKFEGIIAMHYAPELLAIRLRMQTLRSHLEAVITAANVHTGECTPEKLAYHSTARDEFASRTLALLWETIQEATQAMAEQDKKT